MEQLELPILEGYYCKRLNWRPKPITSESLESLVRSVNSRKRMKAAHEKKRCWLRCLYCERMSL